MENGADVNARDTSNRTALIYTSNFGNNQNGALIKASKKGRKFKSEGKVNPKSINLYSTSKKLILHNHNVEYSPSLFVFFFNFLKPKNLKKTKSFLKMLFFFGR